MKRIFLLLAIMTAYVSSFAQTTNPTPTKFTNGLGSDTYFNLPTQASPPTSPQIRVGSMYHNSVTGLYMRYNGTIWESVAMTKQIADSLLKYQVKLPITLQTLSNKDAVYYDGYADSDVDTAYNRSEGMLVTLPNGDILNIYTRRVRLSEQNDDGAIVKRRSTDGGKTWGAIDTVYNEASFDDRGAVGGLTDDGRLVIWFQKLKVSGGPLTQDIRYIYSTDGTYNNYSAPTVVPIAKSGTTNYYFPCGRMIKNGAGKYLQVVNAPYWAELFESTDGTTWTSKGLMWDYSSTLEYKPYEVSMAYVGSNRIIALVRDENKGATFQFQSVNNGTSWGLTGRTNLSLGLFSPLPVNFYDLEKGIITSLTSERNTINPNASRFFAYSNTVNEVWDNPTGYTLKKIFNRPLPNSSEFTGYSAITKRSDGSYFVTFTDSYLALGTNSFQKDFFTYQFNIKFINSYFGQNIASEYSIGNYEYNIYNGKYEPTTSGTGTRTSPAIYNKPSLFNNAEPSTITYNKRLSSEIFVGGKIGINTYNPTNQIEVVNGINSSIASLKTTSVTPANGSILQFIRSRYANNNSSNSPSLSGFILGDIQFRGINTGLTETIGTQITATQDSTATASLIPSKLDFITGGVSRFTIKPNGNIAIGVANPLARLHIGSGGTTKYPLIIDQGTRPTTKVAGGIAFEGDKLYTAITTGTAEKEITLNDIALNVNTVPYTTTNGRLTSSAVTPTELGNLSGSSSNIQSQLNGKLAVADTAAMEAKNTLQKVTTNGNTTNKAISIATGTTTLATPVLSVYGNNFVGLDIGRQNASLAGMSMNMRNSSGHYYSTQTTSSNGGSRYAIAYKALPPKFNIDSTGRIGLGMPLDQPSSNILLGTDVNIGSSSVSTAGLQMVSPRVAITTGAILNGIDFMDNHNSIPSFGRRLSASIRAIATSDHSSTGNSSAKLSFFTTNLLASNENMTLSEVGDLNIVGKATVGGAPVNANDVIRKTELDLKQNLVTLTTTGTSGVSTFNQSTGVLNIPNYATGSGTVTSVTRGLGFASTGTSITTTGTLDVDTTVIRTVANSLTKAQVQTGLNLKANLSGGNTFTGTQIFSGLINANSGITTTSIQGFNGIFTQSNQALSLGSLSSTLSTNFITGSAKAFELPNTSGTLALIQDTTSTLATKANLTWEYFGSIGLRPKATGRQVTNTTTLSQPSAIFENTGTGQGLAGQSTSTSTGYAGLFNNTSATNTAAVITLQHANPASPFLRYVGNGNSLSLNAGSPTTARVQTFQDKDGTIALTSDVGVLANASASGNGSSTTITIPHGISGVTSTSFCIVQARNAASSGISYVTTDATNVYVTYTVAPASGSGNLSYSIHIKP